MGPHRQTQNLFIYLASLLAGKRNKLLPAQMTDAVTEDIVEEEEIFLEPSLGLDLLLQRLILSL